MMKLTDNLDVIFKNPRLIYKLAGNYIRIFFKKNVLGAVELAITYDCNLVCRHCSSANLHQRDKPYLALEEIKEIVFQLTENGAYVINLTGGEPLLREDVFDIISLIKGQGVLATLLTNGHLLTKGCAKELKRLSLDAVQVSINGAEEGSFEQWKTGASLSKAFSGIENAKLNGLKTNIGTILTNESINNGQIKGIIKFCRETNSVLNLIIPCAVGRWSGDSKRLLSDESWNKFQELCKMKGVRTDTHMNYCGNLCPAGRERIYISAYGEILPCDFIHITFGNLKNESLVSILGRIKDFLPIKNRKTPCLAGRDLAFIREYLNFHPDKNYPYSYKDFIGIKCRNNNYNN